MSYYKIPRFKLIKDPNFFAFIASISLFLAGLIESFGSLNSSLLIFGFLCLLLNSYFIFNCTSTKTFVFLLIVLPIGMINFIIINNWFSASIFWIILLLAFIARNLKYDFTDNSSRRFRREYHDSMDTWAIIGIITDVNLIIQLIMSGIISVGFSSSVGILLAIVTTWRFKVVRFARKQERARKYKLQEEKWAAERKEDELRIVKERKERDRITKKEEAKRKDLIKRLLQFEVQVGRRISRKEMVRDFGCSLDDSKYLESLVDTPDSYVESQLVEIKPIAERAIKDREVPTLYYLVVKMDIEYNIARKVGMYLIDEGLIRHFSRFEAVDLAQNETTEAINIQSIPSTTDKCLACKGLLGVGTTYRCECGIFYHLEHAKNLENCLACHREITLNAKNEKEENPIILSIENVQEMIGSRSEDDLIHKQNRDIIDGLMKVKNDARNELSEFFFKKFEPLLNRLLKQLKSGETVKDDINRQLNELKTEVFKLPHELIKISYIEKELENGSKDYEKLSENIIHNLIDAKKSDDEIIVFLKNIDDVFKIRESVHIAFKRDNKARFFNALKKVIVKLGSAALLEVFKKTFNVILLQTI